MVDEAKNQKKAGAEFIVICTNTMHLMAPDIEAGTGLKVIHITEATGDEILKRGVKKILLFGTKFTMEGTFYRGKLEKMGIEVIIPAESDRQVIHDIIYNELILGDFNSESRRKYVEIINKAAAIDVTGVVLGCTEIPLLIRDKDVDIEVFDTTEIHARAAVDFAIEG